ncbi:hypothetical protein P0M11_02780 [Kaistella sp. PBT33-4]|uniref:hypothetical protein n=1 Tax=Kaistella sp. PBT33-4 TaxID=3032000 RepID=UPI0023D8813B|nr:hypothetical protein [Kaistella sp. PBT33-4]MDF0718917.1 hypothetical protein [Kaistella sp. PBT33-4]
MKNPVPVFESESEKEIITVKALLEDAGIAVTDSGADHPKEDNGLASLFVDLPDEAMAFKIIDAWLQENESE